MQDRPTAQELLSAIADFLVMDVEPHVPDWLKFQLRVARNSLAIVGRELEHEDRLLMEEWHGLNSVLGERPLSGSAGELREVILARNEELSARIRDGEFDAAAPRRRLLEHLRKVVEGKLLISNPRYVQTL